ncbi:WG repeat protein [Oceanihabitans sediminis]|uniref:WG repeat-containing protein n=1 Tax=Oceanihabitans sediminis TaxID=1812012 RepID=A0A368P2G0_9FLAO|nr:WG repeat-containing protein [Oceanihabitans sediminis]RBP28395.1 WG repeat protein [Oceanihabitans sediminis]RCU56593.1 WG repeat-containing protein [Oceanihabitans sediminis]
MKYNEIKVSKDGTYFIYKNKQIFNKRFLQILKFHSEGLAPVCEESGWYHIDISGKEVYKERYDRAFGFYFKRASVVANDSWFHINEKGKRVYDENYAWTGNYQEKICSVRDFNNQYFHIDLKGKAVYKAKYKFVGDFKDGYACVKQLNGFYKHIDKNGNFLNDIEFLDLGVFHKNYAIAKDNYGWYHIDITGNELYADRYAMVEPFYNGYAVVDTFDKSKQIINEKGAIVLKI